MNDLVGLLDLYRQHCPQSIPEVQAEAEAIDLEFLLGDLPRLLASMQVGADRIREIVLSLRNFSRMDEAEMKVVDIHEGIDSTLMILQNRLKAKPGVAAIGVIKHYGELPLVECYAGQLNQVFMNILSNALDALEEHDSKRSLQQPPQDLQPAQIEIYTEKTELNRVQIRITDNGIGMTETVCKQMFDPFFTTKAIGKGTGLGLSISYQIVVEKHGGTIQCVSSPGAGTKFIIEIPILCQGYKK